jgi:hypothetical protein
VENARRLARCSIGRYSRFILLVVYARYVGHANGKGIYPNVIA